MEYKKYTAGRGENVHAVNNYPRAKYIRNELDRDKRPSPLKVLSMFDIKPGKANAAGFWRIKCPFHKQGKEKNPSFDMHQVDGYFKCHACGAKGGDTIAFYMQMTDSTFSEAIKTLGIVRGAK